MTLNDSGAEDVVIIGGVPRKVFAFLYLMWGGVWCKYVTFISPKSLAASKQDVGKLTRDCEAIIWVLKNADADYSDAVAKGYSNEKVLNFAMSSAVIYLHEGIFELCGVEFDTSLLSEDIRKEEVLRFYVDYPPDMSIVRYLYSCYAKNITAKFSLAQVEPPFADRVKDRAVEIAASLESIGHFDALDYAIALKDYEHPERAEAFIKSLKSCLNSEISKQLKNV